MARAAKVPAMTAEPMTTSYEDLFHLCRNSTGRNRRLSMKITVDAAPADAIIVSYDTTQERTAP